MTLTVLSATRTTEPHVVVLFDDLQEVRDVVCLSEDADSTLNEDHWVLSVPVGEEDIFGFFAEEAPPPISGVSVVVSAESWMVTALLGYFEHCHNVPLVVGVITVHLVCIPTEV